MASYTGIALLLFLSMVAIVTMTTSASTHVLEGIISNQVLVLNSSVIYTVPSNTTLQLEGSTMIMEPGTTLTLGNGSNLILQNTSLEAHGTEEEPIVITSTKDDEPFGCINMKGLHLSYKHRMSLKQVHISNGGYGCSNFIDSLYINSIHIEQIRITNVTSNRVLLCNFAFSLSIRDSIFLNTGSLSISSMGAASYIFELSVIGNVFRSNGIHSIGTIYKLTNCLIKDNYFDTMSGGGTGIHIMQRGSLILTMSNNTMVSFEHFVKIDINGYLPLLNANSTITLNDNKIETSDRYSTILSISVGHGSNPNNSTVSIIFQNNTIHHYGEGRVASVHLSSPTHPSSLISRFFLSMNENKIYTEHRDYISKWIDVTSSNSSFIADSRIIDATNNNFGTNNFTEIAKKMNGLTIDTYVPFLTEPINDDPCPSVPPPTCTARNIVCPDGYGVTETDDMCSTCKCLICPPLELNCTCSEGYDVYEKIVDNLCPTCACKKRMNMSIVGDESFEYCSLIELEAKPKEGELPNDSYEYEWQFTNMVTQSVWTTKTQSSVLKVSTTDVSKMSHLISTYQVVVIMCLRDGSTCWDKSEAHVIRFVLIANMIVQPDDQPLIIERTHRQPITMSIQLPSCLRNIPKVYSLLPWFNTSTTADMEEFIFQPFQLKPGNYTSKIQVHIKSIDITFESNFSIQVLSTFIVPIPSIITELPPVISNQKKLKLEATVTHNPEMKNQKTEYSWSLAYLGSVRELSSSSKLVPLIIEENTLEAGVNYQIILRAKYIDVEYPDEEEEEGVDSVSVTCSASPKIQKFESNITEGNSFRTKFNLVIEASDAPDSLPLTYSIYYYNSNSKTYVPLIIFASGHNISTTLPPGYGIEKQLKLVARVENIYGAVTMSNELVLTVHTNSIPLLEEVSNELINPNDNTNQDALLSALAAAVEEESKNVLNSANETAILAAVSQKTIDFMKANVSAELNSGNTLSSHTITSKIEVINTFSRSSTRILSTNTLIQDLFSTLNMIMQSSILAAQKYGTYYALETQQIESAASSISNLYLTTNFTSSELETEKNEKKKIRENCQETLNSVTKLSQSIIAGKLISEEETSINTQSFDLIVRKDRYENLIQSTIMSSNANISLPSNISQLDATGSYSIELITFSGSNNPYLWSPSSDSIASTVVSFKLLSNNASNLYDKIALQHLQQPIEIILKKEKVETSNSYKYVCQYWDTIDGEEEVGWKQDGCWFVNETESDIICHCNHTTSFSSMIIYDSRNTNKASNGLYITSIIIHSIFVITCVTLLIIIIVVWRNEQPIKSRYLAPYIGLSAIIMESILNGIIRNSILLGSDKLVANELVYIIMSIVNPLVLVSLFIYFWQMLRYFFQRNLYAIMDVEKWNHISMRILRALSSKILYLVITASILLVTCCYFVVLSIVEGTNSMKANTATTFNAVSFASMSFAIAILIIGAFIWDCIIVLSRNMLKNKNNDDHDHDNSNNGIHHPPVVVEMDKSIEMHIVSKIGSRFINHFTYDDPLVFRVESLIMTMGMLLMLVSYIIGISDRFDSRAKANSAAKILEFLFDVAYIMCRILAFGGLAVMVRFIHKFKLHKQLEQYFKLKQHVSDVKSQGASKLEEELLQLMRDEYGYKLFSKYAKKEFALENLLLWKRLEILRSENLIIMKEDERVVRMKDLYNQFIAARSPYEVNISNKCKKLFDAVITQSHMDAATGEDALLKLYNEVMINICDTYTRFTVSAECHQYKQFRNAALELTEVSRLAD